MSDPQPARIPRPKDECEWLPREKYNKQTLQDAADVIRKSRVLLVGAGGIGCELLKNLVLMGFGEVHIVDLDTIDLSNLNRQFLFRHEHIKKSKAFVAMEMAKKFNPRVKLHAYHGNIIKDSRFHMQWYQKFDIVFNALDNVEARRHVNKMCHAVEVPLIESGTTGFNGQAQVIKKGLTECYDCNPKEAPKSFPVCTIRSTPSQPIHCIVWAKSYLFNELFGTSETDAPDVDHSEDPENAKEIESLKKEAEDLRLILAARGSEDFPRKVFEKVFHDDVKRLQSMEDAWKNRQAPMALSFDGLSKDSTGISPSVSAKNQQIWSLEENFVVFSHSLRSLSRRFQAAQLQVAEGGQPATLTFDKDDEDSLDFVTASANLRSLVFGIEPKSKFETKQMAGNIIPAIATTNAMVASLCALQAVRLIRKEFEHARNVFLVKSAERVVSAERLSDPNPDCAVCGVTQSVLQVDMARATLNDLVENLLRLELGYGEEFSVNNEVGTLYDPDLVDNLGKSFSDLGIKSEDFLTVIDEAEENPRVNLVLAIRNTQLPEASKPIAPTERILIARRPKVVDHDGHVTTTPANGHAKDGQSDGDAASLIKRKRDADDAQLDDEGPDAEVQMRMKRGRVEENGQPTSGKKTHNHGTSIVVDDDNGVIILDDDEEEGRGDGAAGGLIMIADDD